jgi:hypothetical protein
MRRRRFTGAAVALAGVALAMSTPAPAGAAHWPFLGGDAGRSGFQPVDPGGVPAQATWAATGLGDRDVRTSIITTAGQPADQRMMYGTDDGVIHIRILLTGQNIGPAGGTDLSAAADPFGGGKGSASFADSSGPGGLGQVFAVHNERYTDDIPRIEIAQLDEATGQRAHDDVVVAGSEGFRVQSSALLGPADASGARSLFFVAEERNGTREVLFKVPIANPTSTAAVIGAPVMSADVNANPVASPTLVYLRDAGGTPTAYVAVGTIDGVVTLKASDLSFGPAAPGLGGPTQTPSVPVTSAGLTPGADGSGDTAPVIFAASTTGGTTVAHALRQSGNAQVLTDTASPAVPGDAAPALMTDGTSAFVTTSQAIYAMRASDMAVVARFDGPFGFTAAAGTGDIVAVARDDGQQLILDRSTLQPVDGDLFTAVKSSAGSTTSFGQPSISHRFLQIASDRGVFVYGLRQASPPTGYWLAASDGGIFTYGDAGFFGSTGDIKLNRPIITMAATPTKQGYWLAAGDGGIFSFGDAGFFGSTGDIALNKPIVGMVPTRSGQGYWMVASDGGVFTFGDAAFLGSTGDINLNSPIVGMATTATGEGYWLVAADGGIFAFGDAGFFGSTGDIKLNKPIVGMAAVPNGAGYWLVATDGGIFSFGKATFFGSTGDINLNSPIVAMTASATGQGYLFTAADGGVFAFGDAPYLGAAAELGKLNRPVVTNAAKP